MTYEDALGVLGLEQDGLDMRAIKRAYSRKLKTTRPEDDPEGFMAIRQAYDFVRAVFYHQQNEARQAAAPSTELANQELEADPTDEGIDPYRTPQTDVGPPVEAEAPAPPTDPFQQRANEFSELINAVLSDPNKRNDAESWRALIRPRREETLDDWIVFDAVLRGHLIDMYNAELDRREKQPETIAPPTPLIEPALAAGIFKGMDWDATTEVDGQRHHQISWLENQMDFQRFTAPQNRTTSVQRPTSGGDSPISGWTVFWFIVAGLWILSRLVSLGGGSDYSGLDRAERDRILERVQSQQTEIETLLDGSAPGTVVIPTFDSADPDLPAIPEFDAAKADLFKEDFGRDQDHTIQDLIAGRVTVQELLEVEPTSTPMLTPSAKSITLQQYREGLESAQNSRFRVESTRLIARIESQVVREELDPDTYIALGNAFRRMSREDFVTLFNASDQELLMFYISWQADRESSP